MKQYSADKVKNIALLGHGSAGKTTLAEALLYYGKATERIGKTAEGTAILDFDPEEKKRNVSVSTSLYPLEIGDKKINIIDAPGLFDFAGGVTEAIWAADSVIITISGKSGIAVGTEQAYDKAKAAGKAIGFFIGKLDSSHAHFYRVISALTARYGGVVCPVIVPFVEGEEVKCFVDLTENKAYTFDGVKVTGEVPVPDNDDVKSMRDIMIEAVASADEALMEKYFEGEELTSAEIREGLKKGVASGDICPVFGGIQQTGEAVKLLADLAFEIFPSSADTAFKTVDGDLAPDVNGKPALFVFKTIADPFVGKLSYFKVMSGKVKGDLKLKNARTGDEERLAKVMWIKAGKQEDAEFIGAGDIGCVAKLSSVVTGDTLSDGVAAAVTPDFPKPSLNVAVYPVKKGEEEKIANGINRLLDEEPTMTFAIDKETKESILSGLGEQHIDVVVSKLKSKFGVDVELKSPKVAYRETIRKSVKVQGRHKKQSGGHGQFGDVWIEFEPTDSEELVFEEKIFGGSVPKNFFPAVEKGLRESVEKGVLAGFPMVGVKATLVDGSYHPVDSSEMAFKTAASIAFKDGIPQCSPVLLEPVGKLTVIAPDDNLGDIIGDVNKRRGRILGMNPLENKLQEVVGEVPVSEMSDFSTAMRSITGGRATFTLEFERYEQVPDFIAEKIIAENKQAQ